MLISCKKVVFLSVFFVLFITSLYSIDENESSKKEDFLINLFVNEQISVDVPSKNEEGAEVYASRDFYIPLEVKRIMLISVYENEKSEPFISKMIPKIVLGKDSNLEGNFSLNAEDENISLDVSHVLEEAEDLQNQVEGKNVFGINNQLLFSEYQNEVFENQTGQNENVIVYSSGENFKRYFYDEQRRIIKTQKWLIKDYANSKILTEELFYYNEDQNNPYLSTISEGDDFSKIFYNENNLQSSEEKYIKLKDDSLQLLEKTTWSYDEEDNVIEEIKTEYKYREKRKNPTSVFEKKYVYSYHSDSEIPRDYDYYENGELKMKTINTSNFEYENQVFFENDYSVKTTYKNGSKVKEIFISKGKVVRERDYE